MAPHAVQEMGQRLSRTKTKIQGIARGNIRNKSSNGTGKEQSTNSAANKTVSERRWDGIGAARGLDGDERRGFGANGVEWRAKAAHRGDVKLCPRLLSRPTRQRRQARHARHARHTRQDQSSGCDPLLPAAQPPPPFSPRSSLAPAHLQPAPSCR